MINTLQNQLQEIDKSIDNVGEILDEREFQDYCDNAYSCISYLRQCIIKLKRQKEQHGDKENQH